jgi:hypothetical protein
MKPGKSQKKLKNGEQNCRKQKMWTNDIQDAKPPLSIAEKHPDFQVTCCLHFVTTNANFAYIESE